MRRADLKATFALAGLRAWFRCRYPFVLCYCTFICLLVLTQHPQVRNFYLLFLLLPSLLAVRWHEVVHLSRSWVLRLSLALLGVLWASLIWSGINDASEPWRFARIIALNFSFAALTTWLVWRADRFDDHLARWFGSASLAAALVWLVLFYSHHSISERFEFEFSLFPNPNTAGMILGVVAVIAANAAVSPSASVRWRYLHGATASILFGGVALTGSRESLLASILSITAILLLHRLWGVTVLSLLSGALLVALSQLKRGGLSGLVARDGYRLEVWLYYWQLAKDRLLTGYGIGNENHYQYVQEHILIAFHPHNMLLGVLLYGGVLAAILFMALMACLIIYGIRMFRHTGRSMPFALSLYMIVAGLFESVLPIHRADWVWIYFWLPVGMVAGTELRFRTDGAKRRKVSS
jgi:O-antigen ligase